MGHKYKVQRQHEHSMPCADYMCVCQNCEEAAEEEARFRPLATLECIKCDSCNLGENKASSDATFIHHILHCRFAFFQGVLMLLVDLFLLHSLASGGR